MANDYHEPASEMTKKQREIVRAINSLKEEIEAVDWYYQRVAVTDDKELKEIMWHNAEEEIEHAMMTLEWLRRNQEGWDEQMRTYLFCEGNIMEAEENAKEDDDDEKDDKKSSKSKKTTKKKSK
ncbi:ferritin [Peptoniphilus sp. HMSC075B08]|uniref:encapsulin-associated ferritin-like protein n=1 Tax=Peptoniphilus sp. HMSC075B08 TaxID=1739525 RepID=UPI0008A27F49|nr:encapsulin-associated ferritin-like protein [Peptoniphilus sp. HMSC075B08]OFO61408.1 ferritin [Peptoniphilus sp. HMSC075B08]